VNVVEILFGMLVLIGIIIMALRLGRSEDAGCPSSDGLRQMAV
jgi:hypothetical protein